MASKPQPIVVLDSQTSIEPDMKMGWKPSFWNRDGAGADRKQVKKSPERKLEDSDQSYQISQQSSSMFEMVPAD